MLTVRRLYPDEDRELLAIAHGWDTEPSRPRWYREMDATYGAGDFDAYIAGARGVGRIDVGMFDDGELRAVFVFSEQEPHVVEVHLMVKRGTLVDDLVFVANQLKPQLFELGVREIVAYPARKNYAIRQLCRNIGFVEDGCVMIKGVYRGRVIEWLRHSLLNEASVELTKVA